MKKFHALMMVMTSLLFAALARQTVAQTLQNLSLKATRISASYSGDEHPVSLVNNNRTGVTDYWSSYRGEESLGQWEYVELQWDRHNEYKEVRAYWAADGDVIVPDEAYVSWWDGH